MARPIDIQTPDSTSQRAISWTAVVAGALTALSLGFLVHVLNLGIGLTGFTTDTAGVTALAVGGSLWLIICAIVTMFVAGWVAGRIASRYMVQPLVGLLHGFLAWSLALVIGVGLMTNVAGGFMTAQATNPTVQRTLTMPESSMTKRQVIEAEKVATTMGTTALAAFFILLFGGISASVGGYYGTKDTKFL